MRCFPSPSECCTALEGVRPMPNPRRRAYVAYMARKKDRGEACAREETDRRPHSELVEASDPALNARRTFNVHYPIRRYSVLHASKK